MVTNTDGARGGSGGGNGVDYGGFATGVGGAIDYGIAACDCSVNFAEYGEMV